MGAHTSPAGAQAHRGSALRGGHKLGLPSLSKMLSIIGTYRQRKRAFSNVFSLGILTTPQDRPHAQQQAADTKQTLWLLCRSFIYTALFRLYFFLFFFSFFPSFFFFFFFVLLVFCLYIMVSYCTIWGLGW